MFIWCLSKYLSRCIINSIYICMYVYIYMYIYIYVYIYKQTIFPTSFGRGRSQWISRICDSEMLKGIWRYFMTDISYFRPYTGTKNNLKVCMKWIQFRYWFRPCGAKVSSFIILRFFCCSSLSFNVSVDVMRMFLSRSMIMIFTWLLNSWLCLLKCLQPGIALGFLTTSLWLLSLMLNRVSDLPAYWMLQI